MQDQSKQAEAERLIKRAAKHQRTGAVLLIIGFILFAAPLAVAGSRDGGIFPPAGAMDFFLIGLGVVGFLLSFGLGVFSLLLALRGRNDAKKLVNEGITPTA